MMGWDFLWSQNACGSDWNAFYVCSLPTLLERDIVPLTDGDESSGVPETLVFPLSGVMEFLEVVRP